jgi:ADP-ribosyl-[dinitrogen reductase] hydrolase
MHEHFRWRAGEDRLSTYESSPGKLRHFCAVCGTHLMAEHPDQPHVILRVATLDDDPGPPTFDAGKNATLLAPVTRRMSA